MIFIDKARIYLQAGSGGDGRVSFRRRKFFPKCGPDGGHGGRGGSISLVADSNLNTLADVFYSKKYIASNGANGGNEDCSGHAGKDMKIRVPVGTQIMDAKGNLLCDLIKADDSFLAVSGGHGGTGNASFKSSTQQAPRHATTGKPGESGYFIIHFKIIAKVGIIGLPNVGKSSLLASSSHSKTPISEHPYSTVQPVPGFVVAKNFDGFIMLDLPGIRVAGKKTGTDQEFFGHLARCPIILHILSAASDNIVSDYQSTRDTITALDPELLSNKTEFIVINKIDLINQSELKEKMQAIKKYTGNKTCYTTSTISETGIIDLNLALYEHKDPVI